MARTFFIAGTDTAVGKTLIAAALLYAANEQGLQTAAIKPVAAGCDDAGHNEDALLLQEVMSMDLSYEQVNPVALEEAIAPHIAAQHEGRRLQVSRLSGFCRGVMMSGADLVLVEGAGGWRVPLNNRETLADLARELQLEVVLVVAMKLGCLNHALLTAEAIQRDGLRLAGWVANRVEGEMNCYEENLQTLTSSLRAPLLGEVPHYPDVDYRAVSRHLELPYLLGK